MTFVRVVNPGRRGGDPYLEFPGELMLYTIGAGEEVYFTLSPDTVIHRREAVRERVLWPPRHRGERPHSRRPL